MNLNKTKTNEKLQIRNITKIFNDKKRVMKMKLKNIKIY